MSIIKDTISRVGEAIGNAFNHSFSPNADRQSLMPPDVLDTEIALHGSKVAREEKKSSRARVKAAPNLTAKQKIWEDITAGDKFGAIEIPDDDDSVQILSPKSPKRHVQRDTTNSARQQRGSRTLGQSREAAEEEEARRLLGTSRREDPAQSDAVAVEVPGMASHRKKVFVGGGLQPLNTLGRGRSEYINTTRNVGQKPSTQAPKPRAYTSRDSVSAYSGEAEGSPPRKRQRTGAEHEATDTRRAVPRHIEENEEERDDPLHLHETMKVSERTKKTPLKSAIKHTAMRGLSSTDTRQTTALSTPTAGGDFLKNAITKRREDEAQELGSPLRIAPRTPPKKMSQSPGVSKIRQRINGRATTESPDPLHKDVSTVSPLSPLAPAATEFPRFNIKTFYCAVLAYDVDHPGCYLLVCPEVLQIRYKNDVLSKDARFEISYSKISVCRTGDNRMDEAVLYMRLRGGALPNNAPCYFVFHSPKQCRDFVTMIQQRWMNLRVIEVEFDWLQNALRSAQDLGLDASLTHRAQLAEQIHSDKTTRSELLQPSEDPSISSKRKRIRLDPSDRPPDQKTIDVQHSDVEKSAQIKRPTRNNLSAVSTNKDGMLPERRKTKTDEQNPTRTRSHFVQQRQADEEQPRPKSEPRLTGLPWHKPLTYPSDGPKKQTIEWADLKRLEDEELLNDSIVGLFLRYIQENADEAYSKQIHTMSTFFYETLMRPTDGKVNRKQINYAAVAKWTKSVDIFQRDFVIVPINENLHWYTLLVCNLGALTLDKAAIEVESSEDEDTIEERPTIPSEFSRESKNIIKSNIMDIRSDQDGADPEYEAPRSVKRGAKKKAPRPQRKYDVAQPVIITLDSLDTGGRSSTASMLKDYVVEEGLQKRQLNIDKLDIKGMTAKGIPHQGNFSDCGLYVCLYLERFMSNPRVFVDAVLRRENSALPWPRRLSSSKMRQRFYDFLQELYRAQEAGEKPRVPEVGKILVRDEDYKEPEPKVKPVRKSTDGIDLDKMQKGLIFASKVISDPNRHSYNEADRRDRTTGESDNHQAGGHLFDSIQDYLSHENEPVTIDDDKGSLAKQHSHTSPYFALPNDPTLPELSDGARRLTTPQALASNLRERRKSTGKQKTSERNVIDLSSPVKPQVASVDIDTEREVRHSSVSTDFLTGPQSYENGTREAIQPDDEARSTRSKISTKRSHRTTAVVNNSQPEKTKYTSLQHTSTSLDEGMNMGDGLYDRVGNGRDGSVVPESQYSGSDDDVHMMDARSVGFDSGTIQRTASSSTVRGGDEDRDMLFQ